SPCSRGRRTGSSLAGVPEPSAQAREEQVRRPGSGRVPAARRGRGGTAIRCRGSCPAPDDLRDIQVKRIVGAEKATLSQHWVESISHLTAHEPPAPACT